MNDSNQTPEKRSRIWWALFAISPAFLMLAFNPNSTSHENAMWIFVYTANPAISILAFIKLFRYQIKNTASRIVLGVAFGIMFAVVNAIVGLLGGCICHAGQGRIAP